MSDMVAPRLGPGDKGHGLSNYLHQLDGMTNLSPPLFHRTELDQGDGHTHRAGPLC